MLYLFSLREWERNEIGWFLPTLRRSGCPGFIWKNLRSHCFFPKLLSSSTNKLKRSFQTTSPMQIITKPSFDIDLIAHCEKDFPSDPWGLRLCLLFLCSHQIHSYRLLAAFVYRLSTSWKGDVRHIWSLSSPWLEELSNITGPGLLKETQRGQAVTALQAALKLRKVGAFGQNRRLMFFSAHFLLSAWL